MISRALRRLLGLPVRGSQVIGEIPGFRVHVKGPVNEKLIEGLAAELRRTGGRIQQLPLDAEFQPLGTAAGTAVGTRRLDLGPADVDTALDRYAGERLADLDGRTVTIDVPADAVGPGLAMLAEVLDPAVALAELAPCCGTLLQAVTDTGVAECRCRRHRVHVTGSTP